MALCGIGQCPNWERAEIPIRSFNLSTRLVRPTFYGPLTGEIGYSSQIQRSRVRFSISSENATPLESEESASDTFSDSLEEELGHVMKFKMSDFEICDRVSIGLGGRVWPF